MRPRGLRSVNLFLALTCALAGTASPQGKSDDSGVVVALVDEAGNPVPGGAVADLTIMDRAPGAQGPDWPKAQVRSDGTIVLKGLHAGRYAVGIKHPEYDVEPLDLEVPPAGPIRVALKKRGWIEGRLVTAAGEPIPGADIECTLDRKEAKHPDLLFLEYESDGRRSSHTGPDGRFRIDGPISGVYSLCLQGDSCVASVEHVEVSAAAGSDLGDVTTTKAGAVDIAFRMGTDPLPEAEVYVNGEMEVAGRPGDPSNLRQSWSAKTDARGHLLLKRMLPGRWSLVVSFFDLHCLNLPLSTVTVRGGETCETGLAIGGGTIAGVVVVEEGQPVVEALVGIPSPGQDTANAPGRQPAWDRATRSADGGAYLVQGLDAGTYLVGAWKEGYVATFLQGVVVPLNSRPADVRLVLQKAALARLEIRVLHADRTPFAGATMRLDVDQREGGCAYPSVTADGEGLVVQPGLPVGECKVTIHVPDHAPCTQSIRLGKGDNGPIDFIVGKGATLTGRVVDGAGVPVAGASVDLEEGERLRQEAERTKMMEGHGFDHEDPFDEMMLAHPESGDTTGKTAADGSFRIAGVPEGKYGVVVRMKGHRTCRSAAVETTHDATISCGDLVLEARPQTSSALVLKLVAADTGHPAPPGKYSVRVTGASLQADSYVQTDGEGVGTVAGEFPFGAAALSVSGNDLACEPTAVVIDAATAAAPVEVKLSKAASVSGSVLDPTGHPVVGANLCLDGSGVWQTDTEGKFAIRGVLPGDHRLSAESDAGAPARVEVGHLALGESREGVVLRLPPPASIAGRVVDKQGAVVAGARVQVMCLEADGRASSPWWGGMDLMRGIETDAEGRFHLERLPSGKFRFEVWAGARGHGTQDAELPEGQALQLPDLQIEK